MDGNAQCGTGSDQFSIANGFGVFANPPRIGEMRLGGNPLPFAGDGPKPRNNGLKKSFATARSLMLNMGTQINQIAAGQRDPELADLARKQALDQARKQFDACRAALRDDETFQSQVAALHRYAGNVSRTLSDYLSSPVPMPRGQG